MSRVSKLNLPTIETCPWRTAKGAGESAQCGIVTTLTGSSDLSNASREECDACCRSFPPTPQRLNPVVAGLVYRATCQILDTGGTDQCSIERAMQLHDFAEQGLDLFHHGQFRLTPVRYDAHCCFLGEMQSPLAGDTGTCGNGSNVADPIYSCRHPLHAQTTLNGCRHCRDWSGAMQAVEPLSLMEMVGSPAQRSGPSVRRWGVAVTTAPRRQPTLEHCLDALVRAGWAEPHLFLDGTCRIPSRYEHCPTSWREHPVGALPAWYMALMELIHRQPDADAYMLLQDDVVVYDRESLREYLEQVLWPGNKPAIVSLFLTAPMSEPGWGRSQGNWHWGAQGFIFPPGIARALLCDSEMSRACLAASAQIHVPIPSALFDWVHRRGIDVWYANPSLSQHIGNTSTIWMDACITGGRRAPWFSGSVEVPFAAEETLADFPEEAFSCRQEILPDYTRRVERGRRAMRDRSVVICGLCRDVRIFLPRTAARIERLGEMFRDYRVVLFENDSVDATVDFLRAWQQQNPRVTVISEPQAAKKYSQVRCLERAAWMAWCRNQYRERAVNEFGEFDDVIVVDTDLPGGWSYDGIAHTYGEDGWDFVGSNGLKHRIAPAAGQPAYLHFDIWAFHPAQGTAARKMVNHNDLDVRRGDPLLPVESCFGGLGIYRMECMKAAQYAGGDCEHVILHEQLRRAGLGRMYLNPSQIALYSPLM